MGRPKRGEDDGRERLLAAAVTLLDTTAESTLRLDDVATRAGATVPLISHHFGSREQLINEAQEVGFQKVCDASVTASTALSHTLTQPRRPVAHWTHSSMPPCVTFTQNSAATVCL